MPVSATALIVALLFGTMLGFGVARSPDDRALGTRAVGVLLIVGVTSWAFRPEPGSEHAMAAASMTLAGASALAVALAVGARARSQ